MWDIKLFKPDYGQQERDALMEVMDSEWLAMGAKTAAFEEQFAEYLGKDLGEGVSCLAVSNCTAALHISLLVANIGPGDEVLIPATTFVADVNVVAMTGASPVVVDSTSLDDWNMSYEDILKKISSKTKAIIGLHFGGYPFDRRISQLAKKENIILIEDVAHAIGASLDGRKCGTIGDMAAFSFFANKNLAIGEGGLFVSKKADFLSKAKLLRSHGMTALSFDRFEGRAVSYDVLQPGLNYRMDELRSALGLVQLAKLDDNNKKRKKLAEQYQESFRGLPIVIPFQDIENGHEAVYHIFPILLPKAQDQIPFIEYMKKKKIQTSIHYPSFKQFSFYKERLKDEIPISEEISRRVVTLPLYPVMSQEDMEKVTKAVRGYFS